MEKTYHVTQNEAEIIFGLRKAGWSMPKIAKCLERSYLTIFNVLHNAEKYIKEGYQKTRYQNPYEPRGEYERRPRLSEEAKNNMRKDFTANIAAKELSKKYGCHISTVYHIVSGRPKPKTLILKPLGLDLRCKLTDEDIVEIREEYEKGAKLRELARAYHVDPVTIKYHVDPETKERMNRRAKEWRALNVSREQANKLYLKSYLRKREIIAKMSPEEFAKLTK